MLKPETTPWKDSNLALLGSEIDRQCKHAASLGEEQWHDLGVNPCLKIWRIEQFKVVPWPEKNYGKFYEGDSYIVLKSYIEDGEDKLQHNLHIWIGSQSSQDEYGTAAYKMVEADDFLNDAAIQHREVQGYESELFRSYFDGPLMYWNGGVKSGFRHVEPTVDHPDLYRIKITKKKKFSMTQMSVKRQSLNSGDSFILTVGSGAAWLWNGEHSKPMERYRANALAETFCTEGTAVVLLQGCNDDDEQFWSYFPDDSGEIQPHDDDDEMGGEFTPALYRLPGDMDADPEEIAKADAPVAMEYGKTVCCLDHSLLDVTDVFLLDAGWGIFVWVGADADHSEKLSAMAQSDKFCRMMNRPHNIPLHIVGSGKESKTFKKFFVQ